MKNLKKLRPGELKTIKGGIIPRGCMSWDTRLRCCKEWLPESSDRPVCPENPF
ncbi:hypothetical protein P2W68_09590 [Chryseobacterium arthrosphaerae]|uniref:hypothetical protein n=1 Tax=Chryseobacterium arthrosphaerae TaxID=651561 RepID=UPI0023E29D59|nr:hypothetical protein [Chryseobacterium arthrosphaerae]WES99866.1 hypothetical protein P2W68_09590 [Chryseobacterium arthrosphaerae]